MENIFNGALRHRKFFVGTNTFTNIMLLCSYILIACAVILTSVLFSGCQKQDINKTAEEVQSTAAKSSQANAVILYSNLSDQTSWELQQARAATAKYRNIENAIKDGYADIEVDVEHMGHHFMKTAIVDPVFDIREPEILVYNKDEKGNQELVAVEYAVPLSLPRPEGFTGTNDVWKDDSGFPFWLLHAWVWSYNPDGVFNWTNPLVHLH
jgi:outer membrane murein-binding lipoprotein Lpp